MSKIEQIKSLFPITTQVTNSIIDEGRGRLWNTTKCIGALAINKVLRDKLGKSYKPMMEDVIVGWGAICGQTFVGDDHINIKATDNEGRVVNMMSLKEPQKITFIVIDEYEHL